MLHVLESHGEVLEELLCISVRAGLPGRAGHHDPGVWRVEYKTRVNISTPTGHRTTSSPWRPLSARHVSDSGPGELLSRRFSILPGFCSVLK